MTTLAAAVAVSVALLHGVTRQPATRASREDAYRANNVGVAYLEQYNHDAAAKSFRRALEIDPQLTLARINLAIALYYVPDLAASMKEAQAVVSSDPKAPQPHYMLGLIAKSENRVDDAVAAFKQVLAIDPTDLGSRVNLAQLLMQRREYGEAVSLLRPAVEAEPYHVTAKYNLGVALTRAGKTEEGQQVMAEFQKLREGGYGTTFSNNYLEQGRYAEAVASTGTEAELVDRAMPDVRFAPVATLDVATSATAATPDPLRALMPGDRVGPGLTLVDVDRDGDLDLVDVSGGRVRLFTNDKGVFTDATAASGLAAVGPASAPFAVVTGDYDNDERTDVFVLGVSRVVVMRQTDTGRFQDVTATAQLSIPPGLHRSAALVDVDHDGDLDLFLVGTAAKPSGGTAPQPVSNVLLRNNGNGIFSDVTSASKVGTPMLPGLTVVPTDYDNRRDIDLLIAGHWTGAVAPVLLKNLRDGTFRDVASEVGLPGPGAYNSVAAADVNKDGYTDFFFGSAADRSVLSLSDGRGRYRDAPTSPQPGLVFAAQFVDYDNDGLLDLVTMGTTGPVGIWRNLGDAWMDVSSTALKGNNRIFDSGSGTFAAGDLDGDGDTDLIVKSKGRIEVLRNERGNRHASLSVHLTGRVSNRSAIGSKVELRAGSLRSRLETSSAWPAPAPADLVFGLGKRPAADVVRVLWPAGILQAEIPSAPEPGARSPEPGAASAPARAESREPRAGRLSLTELDRKPSSCPYLFTWNGERFEFITDFMGGGEMGYVHAPGVLNTPDPEEFTRIAGDKLRAHDGRYELRVTNELEEALFIDRLQLVVVDHPAGVEVHPREGLVEPPFPSFELFAAADLRPPARAIDHAGRDVLDRVRDLDRRYVDDLPVEQIRGYAKRHELILDVGTAKAAPSVRGSNGGAAPDLAEGGRGLSRAEQSEGGRGFSRAGQASQDRTLLLLTGWTDYAFSSDNIAAHQAGLTLEPPSLQVRNAKGKWVTVVQEIGIPVGRPQTVAVDLTGRLQPGAHEVRIVTSMRIYWDQIRVARVSDVQPRIARLDPMIADLRWRGFSAEVTPDGREPYGYDYARVSTQSPWKVMPGRYTREGDVRELLRDIDDAFVVSRPGDEVALSFDATALPPLPAGWTRTFLLHSIGYSKEMDRNSASPDQAWPLPFRTMTRYPYSAPEAYPDTPRHRDYIARWNTRVVGRSVPPIELSTATGQK